MKPLTTLGETPAALDEAPLSGSTADSHIFLKAKFLLCAGFGIFMFLCPLGGDGFNTPLSLLTDAIDKFISTNLPWFLTALVVLSSAASSASSCSLPGCAVARGSRSSSASRSRTS